MREIDNQSNNKIVKIQVAAQTYNIQNFYFENDYGLAEKLSQQIYCSIKQCHTDICDIAANLGFKADNIKNVKNHIFYKEFEPAQKEPDWDEYEHETINHNLQQSLAWKRLEAGMLTQDDITWIKHECAKIDH